MYEIHVGGCPAILSGLPDDSVHLAVTSPPYPRLRDYGHEGQIGQEGSLDEYVSRLVDVFREVRRVLRSDGSLWLNVGDTFAKDNRERLPSGIKRKDLCGVPWRLAFALQRDGWHLRSDVIWQKLNATPESIGDRPSRSHEYLFLLTKRPRYYYDREAVREPNVSAKPRGRKGAFLEGRDPEGLEKWSKAGKWAENPEAHGGFVSWNPRGRNRRSVWTCATSCFLPATVGIDDVDHFAAYPTRLIAPCILASSSPYCCPECGGPYRRHVARYEDPETEDAWLPSCECPHLRPARCVVLDPFAGTGTTGVAAIELGRRAILTEINPDYARLAQARCDRAVDSVTARTGGKGAWADCAWSESLAEEDYDGLPDLRPGDYGEKEERGGGSIFDFDADCQEGCAQ